MTDAPLPTVAQARTRVMDGFYEATFVEGENFEKRVDALVAAVRREERERAQQIVDTIFGPSTVKGL